MLEELERAIFQINNCKPEDAWPVAIVDAVRDLLDDVRVVLLLDFAPKLAANELTIRTTGDTPTQSEIDWIGQQIESQKGAMFVEGERLIALLGSAAGPKSVLFVASTIPDREFDRDEQAAFSILAAIAASAISRSKHDQHISSIRQKQSDFISLVTHELRLPMTSISGYAELIMSGAIGTVPEKQLKFLSRIKRNVDRMNDLVFSLSEINRVQSGKRKFQIMPLSLKSEVHTFANSRKALLEERQQHLTLEIPDDINPIAADRHALGVVFEQLLTNACNYTDPGGRISVKARALDGAVEIHVADNGIGISVEDQNRIFTPFFRSEDARVREHSGWGLGLALAKALVEGQAGTLHHDSQVEQGTTMILTLPVASGIVNMD